MRPDGSADRTDDEALRQAWLATRGSIAFSMGVTSLGLICLVALVAAGRVDAIGLAIFALFFALTTLGIEVGYHRLLSHRTFTARPAVRVTLAALGAMAMQGPPSFWVTTHRRHHRFADRSGDPHAPSERTTRLHHFWYAHVGWHFDPRSTVVRPLDYLSYTRDLVRDPCVRRVEALYLPCVGAGFLLPALLGAVAYGTWPGALLGLAWGGPIRVFAVNQFVWSINSVCHTFGTRPFDGAERSTNVWWIALVTFGAGWHNGHHAFPASARSGFGILQPDPGWAVVRMLAALGLVHDVRVPDPEMIHARRRLPR